MSTIDKILLGPCGGIFQLCLELWRSMFDVYMPYALIFDMPVKRGLKLMASVSSDRMDTEGKFINNIFG
jgi:hypothetical protein